MDPHATSRSSDPASHLTARRAGPGGLFRPLARILCATALAVAGLDASAQGYRFVDLGGDSASSGAKAVNDRGRIVGYQCDAGNFCQAVQWTGTVATVLNQPGVSGQANGLDARHRSVGWTGTGDGHFRATLWQGRREVDLGTLGGADASANDVNSWGTVVGSGTTPSGNVWHAWVRRGSRLVELPLLAPDPSVANSQAMGINDAGQVVGYSDTGTGTYRATLWNGTAPPVDLGAVPGATNSYALAINPLGMIVGFSQFLTPSVTLQATSWIHGQAVPLDPLPGCSGSTAEGVNLFGRVVGWCYFNDVDRSRATLWIGRKAIDLNGYLDPATVAAGWELTSATSINDRGWIVGLAWNSGDGRYHAFLLKPVGGFVPAVP